MYKGERSCMTDTGEQIPGNRSRMGSFPTVHVGQLLVVSWGIIHRKHIHTNLIGCTCTYGGNLKEYLPRENIDRYYVGWGKLVSPSIL